MVADLHTTPLGWVAFERLVKLTGMRNKSEGNDNWWGGLWKIPCLINLCSSTKPGKSQIFPTHSGELRWQIKVIWTKGPSFNTPWCMYWSLILTACKLWPWLLLMVTHVRKLYEFKRTDSTCTKGERFDTWYRTCHVRKVQYCNVSYRKSCSASFGHHMC